jgi:hypothetical protein
MLAIRHAAENASSESITDDAILAILRGEGGLTSHVLAVFGDVSLGALLKAGASHGIPRDTILDAYKAAKIRVAAANPDLDEALKRGW